MGISDELWTRFETAKEERDRSAIVLSDALAAGSNHIDHHLTNYRKAKQTFRTVLDEMDECDREQPALADQKEMPPAVRAAEGDETKTIGKV